MSRELHHLAAAYAVDALDASERKDFEAHYPSCDVCSQEVIDFRETAATLASSIASAPPADLKAAVMAQVSATRQLPPVVTPMRARSERPGAWVLAAAAAAFLVVGGLVGAIAFDRTNSDPVIELVEASDVRFTTLEGEQGNVQVAYSNDLDQVAVIGSDLPQINSDQAFALWFVLDDGVAPAGLFTATDGDIRQVLNVDDIPTNGWGITVEPATGSPQPTGDIIYVGTF